MTKQELEEALDEIHVELAAIRAVINGLMGAVPAAERPAYVEKVFHGALSALARVAGDQETRQIASRNSVVDPQLEAIQDFLGDWKRACLPRQEGAPGS